MADFRSGNKRFAETNLGKLTKETNRTFKMTALAVACLVSAQAYSQEVASLEEIVVTGTRATIQNSIDLKRSSTTIVDGLSADEIGDIPAASIGEALELLVGSTSHREDGGASEISVRGLGPFLGTTVVNGREATNGGGNRAVNFSIFPSELFNKIAVHKTQSAEYIEGAVSGQVHLDTRRPIEYGNRQFQADIKGNYNPDESNIDDGKDLGGRATLSYIDQFETDDMGTFGVSFGGQIRDESSPKAQYQTGSGGGRLEACQLESFDVDALPLINGVLNNGDECFDEGAGVSNDEVQAILDADNGIDTLDQIPFAYIPRDHTYRQNQIGNEQDAFFGALQWQPNDRLDIFVDFQRATRTQDEIRSDLRFANGQEDVSALTSFDGIVSSVTVETEIEAVTTDFERDETYEGYGINFDYQVNDDLKLSFDYSTSETIRVETDIQVRLAATPFGDFAGSEEFTVRFDLNQGDGTALTTILDTDGSAFEVNDASFFTANNRTRLRSRQVVRENTIDAFRGDLEFSTENLGMIHTVKSGARYSTLEYVSRGGEPREAGNTLTEFTNEQIASAVACANDEFPESDFLDNVRDAELFTNAISGTSVSEYATFDSACLINVFAGDNPEALQFENGLDTRVTDVEEDTFAFYLQADYEGEMAGLPIRGNFGVRLVDTNITSIGYRSPLTITETISDDTGDFEYFSSIDSSSLEANVATNGYRELLPSATLIVDLTEELVLRAGGFRGLSRPDPNAYGNALTLGGNINEFDNDLPTSLEEASARLFEDTSSSGNPNLEPLTSWNFDLGLEWYANDDTLISGNFYYKEFLGGFQTAAIPTTYTATIVEESGATFTQDIEGLVATTETSEKSSTLTGFEFTASHSFHYLPGVLSGLGGKFSYNYADSDFEFEDQHGGDGLLISVAEDGLIEGTNLIGVLPPADIFGLSRHVSSTQVFWEGDKLSLSAIYKTRSRYFQQFTRDTQGRIRYTDDNEVLDLTARYYLTDNIRLSLEAKNILDESRRDYRALEGNVRDVQSYGPRIYFGARIKF